MSDNLDEYTPELFVERIIKNTSIDTVDKTKLQVLCEMIQKNSSEDLCVNLYVILEWIKGLYQVSFENEELYKKPDIDSAKNLKVKHILHISGKDVEVLYEAIVVSADSYKPELCHKLSDLRHRLEEFLS